MHNEIIALFILIILSGVFSASETAFTSITVFQIQDLKKRSPRRGRIIEKLRNRSDIFLITILIGNNIVNIAASAIATEMTLRAYGSAALGISTGIVTFLVLIFGEVTPKRLAISHNEFICLNTVEVVIFLSWVFRPFIYLIGAISLFLTRLTGPVPGQKITLDGVLHLVDLAEDSGVLEYDKTRMMKSILRSSQVKVQTVMTHRIKVFSLEADETVEEVIEKAQKEGFSRIPIYDKNPENMVGVVLAKDIWKNCYEGNSSVTLRTLMMPPVFVSQNMSVYKILSVLKKEKLNLVIVLDEYGGLAGIVTYEDVIEEILGEIYDEDEEKESEKIIPQPDGSYRILGDTPLYEINDILDADIPIKRGAQTLGGYLAELAGTIPAKNDVLTTVTGDFIIEMISKKRIISARYVPKQGPRMEP
jgi:CBS domain containing-hemolysin-like protein